MKGQINIDYAIAVGVFIAGVTTAFTISISSIQPVDSGFSSSLDIVASSVSTEFSDEVSWTIDEKNVYVERNGFNQPILMVAGVKPDRNYSVIDGEMTGSDVFDDKAVFTANSSHLRVLGSDSSIQKSNQSEAYSVSSSEFSNDIIETGFSNTGVDYFRFNGYELIEDISVEDSGVDYVAEGSVSATTSYGDHELFFYGGDLPEFYFDSVTSDSTVSISDELETAEVVDPGQELDLTTNTDYSGSGPIVFYNSSVGVGISGPGVSYTLSSSNGQKELEVEGSYYIHGFEEVSNGISRAETRLKFPRTARNRLEGVNLSQAEELFDSTDTVFQSRLRLNNQYNISFNGMNKGDQLPIDQNLVSQSFDKNILLKNGSLRNRELVVRVWQ